MARGSESGRDGGGSGDGEGGGGGPVEIPIDGVLDLHAFRPQEVKDLVAEYVAECRRRGVLRIRIIHGKGTGVLREIVRSSLARNPGVLTFRDATDPGGGGWGATEAELRPGTEEER